jgi:hypothetical protein
VASKATSRRVTEESSGKAKKGKVEAAPPDAIARELQAHQVKE